jgi:hypothetical protein
MSISPYIHRNPRPSRHQERGRQAVLQGNRHGGIQGCSDNIISLFRPCSSIWVIGLAAKCCSIMQPQFRSRSYGHQIHDTYRHQSVVVHPCRLRTYTRTPPVFACAAPPHSGMYLRCLYNKQAEPSRGNGRPTGTWKRGISHHRQQYTLPQCRCVFS